MSTVNFSVPDEVKEEFNAVFSGQNKSAIIAELMREAVERARRKERSRAAIGRIVARLEELFSRLDAGVAALRHAKAQLQRYRQSVLAAAVTSQLTQA